MNKHYLKALIYGANAGMDGAMAAAAIKQRKWGWALFFMGMSSIAASIAAEALAQPTLDRIDQAAHDFWVVKGNDEEEIA